MKTKILWNACVVLVTLLALSSCDMFINSLGKDFARDKLEVLKNATPSELADLASSTQAANPETAKAIMEVLGKDISAVVALAPEQKEAILNLALGATLPMSTMTGVIAEIDLDNLDEMDDTTINNLVSESLKGINTFDTTAINALLSDKNTLETVDPSKLADSAVASLLQIIVKNDILDLDTVTPANKRVVASFAQTSVQNEGSIDDALGNIDIGIDIDELMDAFEGMEFETAEPLELIKTLSDVLFDDNEGDKKIQLIKDLTPAISVVKLLITGEAMVPKDIETLYNLYDENKDILTTKYDELDKTKQTALEDLYEELSWDENKLDELILTKAELPEDFDLTSIKLFGMLVLNDFFGDDAK